MIYLLLSVLSSTLIFIIFKYLNKIKIESLPVIVLNYFFAALIAFLISGTGEISHVTSGWLTMVITTGVLFIIMFHVLSLSSRKAGISVTSVASKMSVAIPVTFSILYDPQDSFNNLKLIALILALISVVLTVMRKHETLPDKSVVYLPVILFFGMGIVDSLIKLAQYNFLKDSNPAFYSSMLFTVAFLSGLLFMLLNNTPFIKLINQKFLVTGLLLGICNFGSVYFFVKALNSEFKGLHIDSSIVFGINNLSIIILSVLTGLVLFREKLRLINWIGIMTAITSILLFSYS